MKTLMFISIFISLFCTVIFSQTIPSDRLFLGQTPPRDTPKIFNLKVTPGLFAAERIAISNNCKEIFYSEIKGYSPDNFGAVKYYKYHENKWQGPFVLFENYSAPVLSVTSDSIYFETNYETFISTKKNLIWSEPKRIFSKLDSAHYLQVTNKGNYYISSRPKTTIGLGDWCKLVCTASDTIAVGLGMPINTTWDNLDFFVPLDETYMIVTTPWGLSISYPKKDGGWSNPRNLGSKINFGLAMWGPYVTSDNKYLFYTTGTKPDYSDVNVYWVRVDGLIDSLKYTNIPPYAKSKIKSQNGFIGQSFSFTIPENTFFDEDGDTNFTFSATLIDGSPLPSWLSFNTQTKTFSGTPTEAIELKILVTATDSGEGSGIAAFLMKIIDDASKK